MKTFTCLEEMQPYYNQETNTYNFVENGSYFDVCFDFDLKIYSDIYARNINAPNINACDINACDINAGNINAWNIDSCNIVVCDINACDINAGNINAGNIYAGNIYAGNINAVDISFYAVCFAYQDIVCNSITGKRENSKYFCLDGEVQIKKETEVI